MIDVYTTPAENRFGTWHDVIEYENDMHTGLVIVEVHGKHYVKTSYPCNVISGTPHNTHKQAIDEAREYLAGLTDEK